MFILPFTFDLHGAVFILYFLLLIAYRSARLLLDDCLPFSNCSDFDDVWPGVLRSSSFYS